MNNITIFPFTFVVYDIPEHKIPKMRSNTSSRNYSDPNIYRKWWQKACTFFRLRTCAFEKTSGPIRHLQQNNGKSYDACCSAESAATISNN